jgi:hypothetical protein
MRIQSTRDPLVICLLVHPSRCDDQICQLPEGQLEVLGLAVPFVQCPRSSPRPLIAEAIPAIVSRANMCSSCPPRPNLRRSRARSSCTPRDGPQLTIDLNFNNRLSMTGTPRSLLGIIPPP